MYIHISIYAHICPYMSTNMYLDTLFALVNRLGQSMVDTLCLHNNTGKSLSLSLCIYIYIYIYIYMYIYRGRAAVPPDPPSHDPWNGNNDYVNKVY